MSFSSGDLYHQTVLDRLDRYRIESTGFSDATLCDRQQEDDHERLSVKMGREFEENPHGRKERDREELEKN